MGFELKQRNLKGYFVDTMLLTHKGKLSLKAFIKKSYAYGYNGCNLYNKWRPRNECLDWPDPHNNEIKISIRKLIDEYQNIKQDKKWKKISFFFLIKYSSLKFFT